MAQAWQQIERLELVPVESGTIAYDESRDRIHYLNPTAALVLVLCNGDNTIDGIAAAIQEQFGLEHPPAADVAEILGRFVEEGLVIASGPPSDGGG